ncbi:MAG: hypothetical protein EXQ86_08735 [Rhodospirillales bacterium]|nr:hypothetical protein [Rhodospirillales bacterium]
MAIDIGSVSSASIAIGGRQTLSNLGALGGTARTTASRLNLPPEVLSAGTTAEPVKLSIADAQIALGTALIAGRGIVAALVALEGALNVAANSSLVQTSAGVTLDSGTRVSRLNIQAVAGRVGEAIDKLVKASERSGANFISSLAGPIRIQTTGLGGSLLVAPQPLDSAGLGILDLRALSRLEATDAQARVGAAVVVARDRIVNLESLQAILGFASRASQSFSRGLGASGSGILPSGSLVNLVA